MKSTSRQEGLKIDEENFKILFIGTSFLDYGGSPATLPQRRDKITWRDTGYMTDKKLNITI